MCLVFVHHQKARSDRCRSPREIFNLGQQLKPSRERFIFLIIFSGSASGVARGSCGVDLVCLPFGATTETVESPGASCNLQVLISDAPSES
jgi:hypothetical protein